MVPQPQVKKAPVCLWFFIDDGKRLTTPMARDDNNAER
jgi:hypothetical protein